MALEDYKVALKNGEKAYKNALAKGENPYLPALDNFLGDFEITTESYLGLMDIPLDQIIGTKTAGRQSAFACNFMPLMSSSSEFALKWASLYDHQTEVGINDPISVYEFLNHYYVLEGNKRVSVMKALGAFSLVGTVTRIIPKLTSDPQVHLFYEYMDFFRKTDINYVRFTKKGSYQSLIKYCGFAEDHIWTDDDRMDFSSRYLRFTKIFESLGGKKLSISVGDAFLLYISVYSYLEMDDKTVSQLKSEVETISSEFTTLETTPEEALVLGPDETDTAGLITRIIKKTDELNIAFIYQNSIPKSGWSYAHELGRMYVEDRFKGKVHTKAYVVEDENAPGQTIETVLEQAVADKNDIIFTTSQLHLQTSLKAAVAHPSVKILNCSLNRPYRSLRTYYGRMYEAKFLAGMIAGAMAENDKIAYVADFPIYGTVASVNAFANGAAMTNPRAKIYLIWNGKENSDMEQIIQSNNIEIISHVDTIRPGSGSVDFGLYKMKDGKRQMLAAPIWNWGKFYEKIINDIMEGHWKAGSNKRRAMNYWWGISGGIVDLIVSEKLPSGLSYLIESIKRQIYSGFISPFDGMKLKDDSKPVITGRSLSSEDIISMRELSSNVVGEMPKIEELNALSRTLVEVQGILEIDEETLRKSASDTRGMGMML